MIYIKRFANHRTVNPCMSAQIRKDPHQTGLACGSPADQCGSWAYGCEMICKNNKKGLARFDSDIPPIAANLNTWAPMQHWLRLI
jgi:hypothetical protein